MPDHRVKALTARERRVGAALLHQQCWLWGRDIKRAEGNLLLAYRFERQRAPEGCTSSSQYTKMLDGGACVRLWGFGLYFGDTSSGLYLNRFSFEPRAAAFADSWLAESMEGLPRLHAPELFAQALDWIAGYESWVLASYGAAYRRACLVGWRRGIVAESIPSLWHELAALVRKEQD